MATKKVQSIEDSVTSFLDVVNRSGLSEFVYMNRVLVGKNNKGKTVVIVPDEELWLKLIDHEEFKKHIREVDQETTIDNDIKPLFEYGTDLDSKAWIEVDAQQIFDGKIIKLKIENLEYEINLHKSLLPLRLKKAEACDIKYRVYINNGVTLGFKKYFTGAVDNSGFELIRVFTVL